MTVAEFAIPQARRRDRRTALRWILAHAFGHPRVAAMVFVGAFGNAALAAAVPVLIGQAFSLLQDDVSRWPELLPLALMMAGTQVVRGLLQFGRNFGADLLGQRLERDIRDELYLSLLGKSMTFHNLQSVGDLMARATNDVREIGLMFNPGFNLVIGSANFLLLPLLVAPSYHPALIAVPALFILGYVLTLWQYLGELRPVSDQARRAFGRMNSHLSEAIDGIEVVKGHAQEEEEVGRFSVNAGAFRDAFVRQGDIEARFLPLLLLGLAEAGAFLQATLLFRQGALDLGQVVGFIGLIQLFGFPTFISLFAYSQVSLGLAGARRILELMQQEVGLDSNPAGHSARLRGEIEFRQVDFAHAPGEDTLHDLNLHIRPGQTVAVVGQTGSGKSSLVKLVNRIHDVTAGQVLLDGVDVRQWNLASLRSQISIIEQDVFLFSRTIAENIAFGKPGAAQPEVERAAREAQADEFIRGFAEGYRTMVGERGVTLSGGQRQRIALARAFLTDPRILILDDSTSSIDSATEDQIQQAIFRAAEGRTTLIITHRLSQIRWADLILVLRRGRLVAAGTHEELLGSSSAYQRIFARMQED
ncbi:MAG TPA: ABC transporter ATP-binding protein [Anaerolineales bacterium]|nr:ABC transporter ATP-binding protein [Anaerolineales bacterium]